MAFGQPLFFLFQPLLGLAEIIALCGQRFFVALNSCRNTIDVSKFSRRDSAPTLAQVTKSSAEGGFRRVQLSLPSGKSRTDSSNLLRSSRSLNIARVIEQVSPGMAGRGRLARFLELLDGVLQVFLRLLYQFS